MKPERPISVKNYSENKWLKVLVVRVLLRTVPSGGGGHRINACRNASW
jgi:hypothetical protein